MISSLLVFCSLLAAAECRQLEAPLELRVTLAKGRWLVGENLLYRLTAMNKGCSSFELRDAFWFDQRAVAVNSSQRKRTLLRVFGPDGKEVLFDPMIAWGFHRDRQVWANDCGRRPCAPGDKVAVISPGEVVSAKPSIPAPLRRSRTSMDDPGDPRLPPDALPSRERAAWTERAQRELGFGNAWFQIGSGSKAAVPEGFRVLEGYHLGQPGRYRLHAVYAPFGLDVTTASASIGVRRWRTEISSAVIFTSPEISFEVVASTRSREFDQQIRDKRSGSSQGPDGNAIKRAIMEDDREAPKR